PEYRRAQGAIERSAERSSRRLGFKPFQRKAEAIDPSTRIAALSGRQNGRDRGNDHPSGYASLHNRPPKSSSNGQNWFFPNFELLYHCHFRVESNRDRRGA